MVDQINKSTTGLGSTGVTALAQGKKSTNANENVSKNEFLQILVTQLQSQDPLDPMKNDQFAVDLAQFSQLEQLISINDKMGGGGDISSLAGYLGQEVLLNTDTVQVGNGMESSLKLNLEQDASNVQVELLDTEGKVVGVVEAGALAKGSHTVEIAPEGIAPGEYQFKVRGVRTTGGEFEPTAAVAGQVSGFIPGADPKLIVNGQEISPTMVSRVNAVSRS